MFVFYVHILSWLLFLYGPVRIRLPRLLTLANLRLAIVASVQNAPQLELREASVLQWTEISWFVVFNKSKVSAHGRTS